MKWPWQKGKPDRGPDSPRSEVVQVLDPATGNVQTIPAAELAPGMMQVRLAGSDEIVWVEASSLHPADYRHPPFGADVREQLSEIERSLSEVHPLTLEQWEDGFRRDTNPAPEIAYWLHVARTYATLTAPDSSLGSTPQRRKDVFSVLAACGFAPPEHVLKVAPLVELSRDEALLVIHEFRTQQDSAGDMPARD